MADAKTFDLFDFVTSGRTYPRKMVPVYLDHETAHAIHVLEQRIAHELDPEKVNELAQEKTALVEKAKGSVLNFHMRGVPSPIHRDAVTKTEANHGKESNGDDAGRELGHRLVAVHVTEITNSEGESAANCPLSYEDTAKLMESLPDEAVARLLNAVEELTLRARYFEDVEVSPDFS